MKITIKNNRGEDNMNYKKKRIRSGLNTYTIAKELGIPEEKYKKVEQGKLNLEKDLLDKFLEIIRKSKEIKFNRQAKMIEINEWLKNGQAEEDIRKMGYTKSTVSKEIGYDATYVNNMIKSDDNSYHDAKEKLYDFLKNPLNKKINEEDNKPLSFVKDPFNSQENNANFLDEWCITGQAKIDIAKLGYSQIELSEKVFNKEKSYVNNLIHKRNKGKYYSQKQKLYDFLQAGKTVDLTKEENTAVVISQSPIEEIKPFEKSEITTATYEMPSKEENEYILSLENELTRFKETCDNLEKAYKLLVEENKDLLKENNYLRESVKRLFKL